MRTQTSPSTSSSPPSQTRFAARNVNSVPSEKAARSLRRSQTHGSARERLFAEPDATVLKISSLPAKLSAIIGAAAVLNTQPNVRARCVAEPTGIATVAFSAFPQHLAVLDGRPPRSPPRAWRQRRPAPPRLAPALRRLLGRPTAGYRTHARHQARVRSQPHPQPRPLRRRHLMPRTPEAVSTRNPVGLATQSALTQITTSPRPSSFDAHNPPEPSVMDKCVHCGFCLPACPTYALWGEEMDSPRGRIWLMRKAASGEAPLDNIFQTHIDRCLGCMACMTACPSGVEYNKLIEDTRGQVERHAERAGSRSLSDRLFRKLLFATFPHPRRLRALGLPLAIYQRTGLQNLVRNTGLLKLLPARLRSMEALLPPVPLNPFHSLPHTVASSNRSRGRVAMLTGCVQDAYFATSTPPPHASSPPKALRSASPDRKAAAARLMVHSGLDDAAQSYAKDLIATFEAANVDTIVINAAGCGSTMKEYAHLLRNNPAWAARAAAFSAKCKDISEVLAAVEPIAPRRPIQLRVAYHDACHLRHAQGIFAQPRALLAQIPELTVEEIAESNLCCGSAGVYNLLNPEASKRARRPQGVAPARHGRRRGHQRQPRLPASAHERPAPPRRRRAPHLPHGRAPRRLHPRPHGRPAPPWPALPRRRADSCATLIEP